MITNHRQQKAYIFGILFCAIIFLASCARTSFSSPTIQFTPSKEQPTATLFPVTSTPFSTKQVESSGNYNIIKPLMSNPFTRTNSIFHSAHDMSPDGQWVIKDGIYKDNYKEPLTLLNVNDSSLQLKFIEPVHLRGVEIGAWSPDSSAFIRSHYDWNGCALTEMIIINDLHLKSVPLIKSDCYVPFSHYLAWSKDGARVAFTNNYSEEIVTYDRNGNLVNSYIASKISNFVWANDNFIVNQIKFKRQKFVSQIVFISADHKTVKPLTTLSTTADIIEYNLQRDELIMLDDNLNLLVFNLKTKKITNQIPVQGIGVYNANTSPSSRYIGFQVDHTPCEEAAECPEPGIYSFWIFDWENYSIKYYGEIGNLLGWVSPHLSVE